MRLQLFLVCFGSFSLHLFALRTVRVLYLLVQSNHLQHNRQVVEGISGIFRKLGPGLRLVLDKLGLLYMTKVSFHPHCSLLVEVD